MTEQQIYQWLINYGWLAVLAIGVLMLIFHGFFERKRIALEKEETDAFEAKRVAKNARKRELYAQHQKSKALAKALNAEINKNRGEQA